MVGNGSWLTKYIRRINCERYIIGMISGLKTAIEIINKYDKEI